MKKLFTIFLFVSLGLLAKSQTYIVAYEFWCDTAYSARQIVSVAPTQQYTLDTMLGFPGVPKGLHTVNIRFQQNNFFWSQTVSEYFYKTGEGQDPLGAITAYRYWVEGIDTVVTFHLANPVNPFDLVASLDLSWAHQGNNTLYMQFSDEEDNWSVAVTDSFYKSAITVAAFNTMDTVVCGDSVHFQNMSNDADLFHWDFGDGDSSSLENPVHYYASPGLYTVTLTATDSATGFDSTVTYADYITVHQGATASFTFTMVGLNVTFINNSQNAQSYIWHFGDSTISFLQNPVHTYPQFGNYTVVLTAMDSCGGANDTQFVSVITGMKEFENVKPVTVIQSDDRLNLIFNSAFSNAVCSLIDIHGQVVYRNRFGAVVKGNTETIDLSQLAPGAYFLHFLAGNSTMTGKIIKIR